MPPLHAVALFIVRSHCYKTNVHGTLKQTTLIMDSSFLTLPPPYENRATPPSPTFPDYPRGRRGRSPSFLSSVKNIMQQPLKRMRSPGRSPGLSSDLDFPRDNGALSDNWKPRSQSQSRPRPTSSRHSHCGYHTGSCEHSCHACHRPLSREGRSRREPVPSMADYLTLAQLETVWISQDTYKGCVDAPRAVETSAQAGARQRSRSAENETTYKANLRVHTNYSRPGHGRSHRGNSRWESYGNRPQEITEYYGKKD